jgi:hypothetical protein
MTARLLPPLVLSLPPVLYRACAFPATVGYAEWEGGTKEQCVVYWRRPVEWAEMIARRVRSLPVAHRGASPTPNPAPFVAQTRIHVRGAIGEQVSEIGHEGQVVTVNEIMTGDFSSDTGETNTTTGGPEQACVSCPADRGGGYAG